MVAEPDGHARRQAQKREEILAIATNLFLQQGYGRTSMDQIHARLGGSKRTLYNYFQNKEVLFEAIVASVSERVLSALRPPLGAHDLREALVRMGTDYLTVLLSQEGLALYRTMASEAAHFPGLAHLFFDCGPGRASHHLAGYFEDQETAGLLSIDDPIIVAGQFLGAVRGNTHLEAIFKAKHPSPEEVGSVVERAVETFLKGLLPKR